MPRTSPTAPAANAELLAKSVVTLRAVVSDNFQGVAPFRDNQNKPIEEGVTADRVVFFDQGIIQEQGTPEEVIDHPQHERTKSFLSKVL